ncbi:MAG: hypothetical protein ACI31C_08720 [Muribaculaceae bacterium]
MRATVAIILAALLAACAGNPDAVPRRYAYPRVATLDTAMVDVDSLLIHFCVNADAVTDRPRPDWLDVRYPAFGATWHISFTSSDDLEEVKANRMQRLLLNAGDLPFRRDEWLNPAGMDILALVVEGAATPLQFLATDNASIVVSGALVFDDPRACANIDSISPIINILEEDMLRSLQSLRP